MIILIQQIADTKIISEILYLEYNRLLEVRVREKVKQFLKERICTRLHINNIYDYFILI